MFAALSEVSIDKKLYQNAYTQVTGALLFATAALAVGERSYFEVRVITNGDESTRPTRCPLAVSIAEAPFLRSVVRAVLMNVVCCCSFSSSS